ncbi:protein TIFY 5A-like [Solanum lycopersicum]|uniref:Protein TIFY n=1 Tax=Solanum lycopersicum TaxID=4081 RepID=A0A3Q7IHF7_SOLLC|nr:protein TIFY 5A-like [Solanum lycopersicum]
MRRKCNLELTLSPSNLLMEDKRLENEQSQQLTIFYNGKFVASHVTQLQAKAIIYLASREMEEKTNKLSEPSSPLLQPQTVKKSLQRFLQKRKNRIQITSPYHH